MQKLKKDSQNNCVNLFALQCANLHILSAPSKPLKELGDYKTFNLDIFMLCALSFK